MMNYKSISFFLTKKILTFILFFCFMTLSSQEFSKEVFVIKGDTLPYRILLPKNFNADQKYPLVLFLHGAGERGNDNESQLIHGSKLFLQHNIENTNPAIILFPQCPKNQYWAKVLSRENNSFQYSPDPINNKTLNLVESLLKNINSKYLIDSSKIYVGGLSMGGMGTFELVYRNPDLFAAAFAICGGANPKISKQISNTHWRIFHGDKDVVVPVELSKKMFEEIKLYSSNVSLKIYPGVNHNSWDNVFQEPDLLSWLFSVTKN